MDVISDGIVYGVPSKGNHSLYRQANPTLTFVDVESIDDIPENIVYNKVVTVCEEAFWMLKFKNYLNSYTKF